MNKFFVIIISALVVIGAIACEKVHPNAPASDQVLDGPIEGLSYDENRRFLAGDFAFNDEVFNSQNGLGPLFVATSCGSCHASDGKGHPFTTLTRFGQKDSMGNTFLDKGGPQLQNNAMPGFYPEQIPAGASFSRFTPPANTGLGFLEKVADADILEMSDPEDSNGDGISGVPNWIALPSFIRPNSDAIPKNGKYIHRFGKKAAAFDLLHQTVNAYNQDIGITTSFAPIDTYSGLEIGPELPDQTVHNIVFYLQTLKAPIQRNPDNAEVQHGKQVFLQTGCENCHKQTLKTTTSSIPALSNKTFHPYTDLLLHDMGPGLDDGYTEGSAKSSEWRTPPLWGLGLSPNSQGGQYFLMHDGRANSIEEAIGLHGGEASGSLMKFNQLTEPDKKAVIQFLKSL